MPTVYDQPASPPRPATRKTQAIDLHALRVLHDNLHDATDQLPVPLRVVAPHDLDPCAECPDHGDIAPAIAEVIYTAGTSGWTYRVPVCETHTRPVTRWHLRYGGRDIHVDIPAPQLHYIDATPAAS